MNRLLATNEISCRVQQIGDKGLSLLLYITSRAAQSFLDEKYGELGWEDSYSDKNGQLFCTISVWDKEYQRWIRRSDVGTESAMEKEKGRSSDAFKRACVKFGIARELYSAPYIWVPASQCDIKTKEGRNGETKYFTYDKFYVNKITYTANKEIDLLEIINQDLEIVYKQFEGRRIDDLKYKTLLDKMQEADVTGDAIIELLNLQTLKEMSVDQFVRICKKLEKTIETKKGKNSSDNNQN